MWSRFYMHAEFGRRASLVAALLVGGCGLAVQAESVAIYVKDSSLESITKIRVFQEPLVPIGGLPSEQENHALSKALDLYLSKGDYRSVTPLVEFLRAFPGTYWRASLLSNLGWVYRQEGYLGRAKKAWQEAWELSREARLGSERSVADWSAGNLADLLGRLGKRDELSALLKEVQVRTVYGTAGSLLFSANQQLASMERDPAHTLRCGPIALGHLATALGKSDALLNIDGMSAGLKGTNLNQLKAWGQKVGLDLVGVKVAPDAQLPVPALLEWKTGHFATVMNESNGRYLVRNYLSGDDKWISRSVLTEELGSFALASKMDVQKYSLVMASDSELATIWGSGTTTGPDPNAPLPQKSPSCPAGMAQYTLDITQAGLSVQDIPIWYNPPVGPGIAFHVFYNHFDVKQPQSFTYWNFGPKWTMDWLSYITDDPSSPGTNTSIYQRGGGVLQYSGYNGATGAFSSQFYRHDILVRTSSTSYERRISDGSKEIFDVVDGSIAPRKVFLSKIVDPAGNSLTFSYDAQRRLVKVTDALGQITTISYELAADPLKVTKVTDPFGRSAQFNYDSTNSMNIPLLVRITDMGGIASEFVYDNVYPTAQSSSGSAGGGGVLITTTPFMADFMSSLTTPYGKTSFSAGLNGVDRFVQATDPLGQSERAEFHNYTGSMPVSDPVSPTGFTNYYLYYRNTFFWDKRAMASGAGDWTQAKIYHFLHSNQNSGYSSPLLESMKTPLENRIWYGYGQGTSYAEGNSSQASLTARILDDGTNQSTQAVYNDQGKVTKSTDALGRILTYNYSSDGLDLLEIRNTTGTANELLSKYTYNTQHKPITVTDAAGQTTSFTYNLAGQILTITNPKGEVTTFNYSPSQGGYLMDITGAVTGSTTSFTYDGFGRVQTVTGPDGNTIRTDYDNLDRPIKVTYKDGTTEVMTYDKLDMVGKKDRQDRWTYMSYNPLRRLSEVQDAVGRITRFDWCNCGSLEQLTDPMGHITNWWRDLQGRVIGKRLDDGTQTNYTYDLAGRLVSRIDAKGQQTLYQYYLDNNLKQVSYPNALNATPAVNYTYEPQYNRLATMTDQYGKTTYVYNPIAATPILGAGRLAKISGPFANSDISYTYDALGRVLGRDINGRSETRSFDALGRLASVNNPLGLFQYAYQGATGRLDNILLPNSQKTVFSYFDATQDSRLKGIANQKSDNSNISAFSYTYNPDGTIKSWSQQADADVPKVYSFSYDAANQLIGAVLNQGGPTGALIHQYAYGYDLAGNRTNEQIDSNQTTADYNSTNQLTTNRKAVVTVSSVQAVAKSQMKTISPVLSSGSGKQDALKRAQSKQGRKKTLVGLADAK